MPFLDRARRAPWLAGAARLLVAALAAMPVLYYLGGRRWPLSVGAFVLALLALGALERRWEARPLPAGPAWPAATASGCSRAARARATATPTTSPRTAPTPSARGQAQVADVTTSSTDARTIRAPRGTTLSCKLVAAGGRPADAHEQPRPGGRRAARPSSSSTAASARPRATGSASTRSSARCARSRTTRRCSSSPASRSASSARTRTRRACSSPTRCSCRHWATWDDFHELDRKGLMMYGQMTAGSWIYIGTQGILQGTLRDVRGSGAQALRRRASRAGWS